MFSITFARCFEIGEEPKDYRVFRLYFIPIKIRHHESQGGVVISSGFNTKEIDAKILKDYGEIMRPGPTPPRSENQMQLSSLQTRLGQLKALHHQEKCRLQSPSSDKVSSESIKTILRCIERQIEKVEQEPVFTI